MKTTDRTVYRVEHKETFRGPCYNEFSKYAPIMLKNGCHAVDLPTPHNSGYSENNTNYYAAAATLEDMRKWFNESNVAELKEQGFALRGFIVGEVFEIEGHLKFNRNRVRIVFELDIRILEEWTDEAHI